MKTAFTIFTFTVVATLGSLSYAGTSNTMEDYFRSNATPAKLGLTVEKDGVKTTLTLLSCSDVSLADDGNKYGVCTFEAQGYMIHGVYSVIVNPAGYGFAEAVEVGNFLP